MPGHRKLVPLGYISGVHGVRGWVKIHSLTDPREAIFDYQPWLLGEALEEVRVIQGKRQGNRLVALLENAEGRDQAEALVNREISVYRDQLPEPAENQFYWTDLVGLEVLLEDGTALGTIRKLFATGANDVLVVQGDRERLIPFVLGQYVRRVDFDEGVVIVDWDPEF
jgi:16S rRNA processing protein RimM